MRGSDSSFGIRPDIPPEPDGRERREGEAPEPRVERGRGRFRRFREAARDRMGRAREGVRRFAGRIRGSRTPGEMPTAFRSGDRRMDVRFTAHAPEPSRPVEATRPVGRFDPEIDRVLHRGGTVPVIDRTIGVPGVRGATDEEMRADARVRPEVAEPVRLPRALAGSRESTRIMRGMLPSVLSVDSVRAHLAVPANAEAFTKAVNSEFTFPEEVLRMARFYDPHVSTLGNYMIISVRAGTPIFGAPGIGGEVAQLWVNRHTGTIHLRQDGGHRDTVRAVSLLALLEATAGKTKAETDRRISAIIEPEVKAKDDKTKAEETKKAEEKKADEVKKKEMEKKAAETAPPVRPVATRPTMLASATPTRTTPPFAESPASISDARPLVLGSEIIDNDRFMSQLTRGTSFSPYAMGRIPIRDRALEMDARSELTVQCPLSRLGLSDAALQRAVKFLGGEPVLIIGIDPRTHIITRMGTLIGDYMLAGDDETARASRAFYREHRDTPATPEVFQQLVKQMAAALEVRFSRDGR